MGSAQREEEGACQEGLEQLQLRPCATHTYMPGYTCENACAVNVRAHT